MALSAHESRVCDAIAARSAALIEDLCLHVNCRTGHGHEPGLEQTRRLLTERVRRMGATIETVPGDPRPDWIYPQSRPNAASVPATLVCRRPSAATRPVLIAAHLDTVHHPDSEFRELSIAADGKTATGPGCADMKGGIVIAMAALETLHEHGFPLNWMLLLNSDEETGSFHSARAIRSAAADIGAAQGIGIAVEPATPEGGLVIRRAGSGQFRIDVRGRAAHVGRDFASGISAVTALAHAIVAVAGFSEPARDLIASIGPVEGGDAVNVVPDSARAWGNLRFPDPAAADELCAKLDSLAAGGSPAGAAVTVRHMIARPAKPASPAVQALADLASAAAAELGQPLPFTSTAGVCDGNLMQDAGLPTLDTLGVRGGGLHTPKEWIDLASLVPRAQLLALTIMRASKR